MLVWHPHVPLKVSIFVWPLLRDRLPTKANLVTRGILPIAAHSDSFLVFNLAARIVQISGSFNIELQSSPFIQPSNPGSRIGNYGGQVILPLAHTIEHDEFLEVTKLDGVAHSPEDTMMARELFLLQLCSGMDENAIGTCAELIFAPIDASFADDAPLLPSGFRIIPLESGKEASSPNRTLDLASALDVGGPIGNRASSDNAGNCGCVRSVMTIAFEFAFESHMQENVACMACQYVRSIISSVQRVALALSPSHLSSHAGLRSPLGTPEAQTLAHWICNSYRCYLGVDLLKSNNEGKEPILKSLWHHSDAVLCCTLMVFLE
ncbi:homeobox-leucine zipper protein ATHB-15 [Trifolium repens]|nr:homeobox-leucine zipper protein ATHB-15 [Trifolium repens]